MTVFHPALLLSYFFELLALPLHAARLATLRRKSQRVNYELALGLEQELAALQRVIRVAEQMERELADMDLNLTSSQHLAGQALQIAIARLKRQMAAGLEPEVNSGSEP